MRGAVPNFQICDEDDSQLGVDAAHQMGMAGVAPGMDMNFPGGCPMPVGGGCAFGGGRPSPKRPTMGGWDPDGGGGNGKGRGGHSSGNNSGIQRAKHINVLLCRAADNGNMHVLLNLIVSNLGEMNCVNLSTAMHKLARLVKESGRPIAAHDNRLMALHARIRCVLHGQRAAGPTAEVVPRCWATIAWAYGTMQMNDPQVMGVLEIIGHLALPNLGSFNSLELTNLIWGFAKMQVPHARLFHMSCQHISSGLASFSPSNLSTIIWAFVTAGHVYSNMLHQVAKEFANRLAVFRVNSVEVANLMWGLATAKLHPKGQVLHAVGCRAITMLPEFKLQELSITAWAFSRLGARHDEFFVAVAHRLWSSHMLRGQIHPQGIANILWAFERQKAMGSTAVPEIMLAVSKLLSTCLHLLPQLKPQEFTCVFRALTKLGFQSGVCHEVDALLFAAAEVGGPLVCQLSFSQTVDLMEALSSFLAVGNNVPPTYASLMVSLLQSCLEKVDKLEPLNAMRIVEVAAATVALLNDHQREGFAGRLAHLALQLQLDRLSVSAMNNLWVMCGLSPTEADANALRGALLVLASGWSQHPTGTGRSASPYEPCGGAACFQPCNNARMDTSQFHMHGQRREGGQNNACRRGRMEDDLFSQHSFDAVAGKPQYMHGHRQDESDFQPFHNGGTNIRRPRMFGPRDVGSLHDPFRHDTAAETSVYMHEQRGDNPFPEPFDGDFADNQHPYRHDQRPRAYPNLDEQRENGHFGHPLQDEGAGDPYAYMHGTAEDTHATQPFFDSSLGRVPCSMPGGREREVWSSQDTETHQGSNPCAANLGVSQSFGGYMPGPREGLDEDVGGDLTQHPSLAPWMMPPEWKPNHSIEQNPNDVAQVDPSAACGFGLDKVRTGTRHPGTVDSSYMVKNTFVEPVEPPGSEYAASRSCASRFFSEQPRYNPPASEDLSLDQQMPAPLVAHGGQSCFGTAPSQLAGKFSDAASAIPPPAPGLEPQRFERMQQRRHPLLDPPEHEFTGMGRRQQSLDLSVPPATSLPPQEAPDVPPQFHTAASQFEQSTYMPFDNTDSVQLLGAEQPLRHSNTTRPALPKFFGAPGLEKPATAPMGSQHTIGRQMFSGNSESLAASSGLDVFENSATYQVKNTFIEPIDGPGSTLRVVASQFNSEKPCLRSDDHRLPLASGFDALRKALHSSADAKSTRARMPVNLPGRHAEDLTLGAAVAAVGAAGSGDAAQTHTGGIQEDSVSNEMPPREMNPSAYTVKNTFIEATDADNEMLATRACAARFSSEQPRQPLQMDGDSTGPAGAQAVVSQNELYECLRGSLLRRPPKRRSARQSELPEEFNSLAAMLKSSRASGTNPAAGNVEDMQQSSIPEHQIQEETVLEHDFCASSQPQELVEPGYNVVRDAFVQEDEVEPADSRSRQC